MSVVLSVLPVVPPAVFFVVAAVRDEGFGQVLLMLLLGGLSFLVTLTLVLILRVRRSAASPPGMTVVDGLWVGGATLVWVAAGLTGSFVRFALVMAAIIVSAFAARHLFRAIRRVVDERVAGAAGRAGRGPGNGPGAGGSADGPDAGKIIVLEPSAPRTGPTSTPREGEVPGSTRDSGSPRSDSTRAGSNFGANRAPVSPTWDETRPVRDADGNEPTATDDVASGGVAPDGETNGGETNGGPGAAGEGSAGRPRDPEPQDPDAPPPPHVDPR